MSRRNECSDAFGSKVTCSISGFVGLDSSLAELVEAASSTRGELAAELSSFKLLKVDFLAGDSSTSCNFRFKLSSFSLGGEVCSLRFVFDENK